MEKVEFEKLLNIIGKWGQFQIRAYIPLCCVVVFSVFQMSYIFVARDTKYRCKIQNCRNDSELYNPTWLKNAVPYKNNVPSRCLLYMPMYNNTCTDFYKNETYTCHAYVFEKKQTTIVQDFNITCDENLWKLTLAGTVSAIGELFCLPFVGFLSDHFGRKRMIIASLVFSTTVGLMRSYSPEYIVYIILEFLDTALGSGLYSGAFILALEIVDKTRRSTANTIISLAFALGQVILATAAWITSSWRIFLRVIYAPGVLILFSLWYIPESVRWLILKKRAKHAHKVLNTMSKMNAGVEFDKDILTTEFSQHQNDRKLSFPLKEVFKSKKIVIRIIHCSFTWICCTFPYYGLTIQSVTLSENVYANFICTSLVEVPAYFITQSIIDRFGRRKTLGLSLITGGVWCVLVNFVDESKWLSLVIFLKGKFFITVSYTILYIYTAELFPTNSRHSIFAICSMFGRIGSMIAPQIPLLERIFKSLPLIIFFATAVTSGVLAFWLPETLNTELPKDNNEAIEIEEQGG
ncbi:organic cation transporter protein-like [Zophobas morio]